MQIVHICTSDTAGGAARAAFRLHLALLGAGETSNMLVRTKHSQLPSVHQIELPEQDSFWAQLIQSNYINRNRTEISNTFFSLGWPGVDVSGHALIREADVLHLHWVSNFISPASIAALQGTGKPLVWSLHDERAFTGGCHYAGACIGYRTNCSACPQLKVDAAGLAAANLAEQVRRLESGRITVVGSSRWMTECAGHSTLFRSARRQTISCSVETDIFRPQDREAARQQLGWPRDAVCLLFGADFAAERRKGFHELVAAITRCLQQPEFAAHVRDGRLAFYSFGHGSSELNQAPFPIRQTGYIRADADLARIYAAADLFVLPSLEDNLPNTVMESLSCGTPVLAFEAGGVPDMVIEGATGFLAPAGDIEGLAGRLLELTANRALTEPLRPGCRDHAERHFTFPRQAQAWQTLYRELLAAPCAPPPAPLPFPAPGLDLGPNFEAILEQIFAGPAEDLDVPDTSHRRAGDRWRRAQFGERVRRILQAARDRAMEREELLRQLDEARAALRLRVPLGARWKSLLNKLRGG